MKKCPFCAEAIQDEAVVCRYCGRDLLARSDPATAPEASRAPDIKPLGGDVSPKVAAAVIGGAILIFAMLFISGAFDPPPPGLKPPAVEHSTAAAEVMCEQFVKDRLVSPGSARFPWDNLVEDLGGGKYRVQSHVDSENAFGGLLRTEYTCVIQHAGGNRWTLEELEMQ